MARLSKKKKISGQIEHKADKTSLRVKAFRIVMQRFFGVEDYKKAKSDFDRHSKGADGKFVGL